MYVFRYVSNINCRYPYVLHQKKLLCYCFSTKPREHAWSCMQSVCLCVLWGWRWYIYTCSLKNERLHSAHAHPQRDTWGIAVVYDSGSWSGLWGWIWAVIDWPQPWSGEMHAFFRMKPNCSSWMFTCLHQWVFVLTAEMRGQFEPHMHTCFSCIYLSFKRNTKYGHVKRDKISFKVACWHRRKNFLHGPWVYFKGECDSTQTLIWGILGQSGLSIKFSTLLSREAKGLMLNVDQIAPHGLHGLQPVAWPFITCLEGLFMGEGFATDWNVKWSLIVFTLTDACMCECTYCTYGCVWR